MTFTVQYEYYIKNSKYPNICTRPIELPKWNMTEARNKLLSMHPSNVIKIVIIGHQ